LRKIYLVRKESDRAPFFRISLRRTNQVHVGHAPGLFQCCNALVVTRGEVMMHSSDRRVHRQIRRSALLGQPTAIVGQILFHRATPHKPALGKARATRGRDLST